MPIKTLTLVCCVIFVVDCLSPLAAQSITSSLSNSPLDKIVSDSIQKHQPIPDSGIAVAVIKDRAIYYSAAFGFRDLGSSAKVDPETLFPIGSATKAFTSMAVSMLAERAAIRLDIPINQYLPDFAMQDPEARAKMTLEDVLSHRTGLPRHDALWYLSPFSRSQLFHRLRYLDPNSAPGKGFRKAFEYNNMTYNSAAYVLESVSGDTWDAFIRNRILNPLRMTKTNLSIADFSANTNHAKGYSNSAELPVKNFDNIGPAAEINSNLIEMTNWILLHLNRGITLDGTVVIHPAYLEKMYSSYIEVGSGVTYGLGWFVTFIQGKRLIFHMGSADGYSAYVSFMPDDGLGVIVLTNQHKSKFPDHVAADIYGYLLTSASDQIQSASKLAYMASEQSELVELTGQREITTRRLSALSQTVVTPNGDTRDYTGMFSHPGYGDISVTVRGNSIEMSYYGYSWLLQKLRPDVLSISPDFFYISLRAYGQELRLPVTFNRAVSGDVDKLSIPLEPAVKQIQFVKR